MKKVFVAGHKGMVGSAICRQLEAKGGYDIVTRDRQKLELSRQDQVEAFFKEQQLDEVYLAAAKVGGIVAVLGFFMYLPKTG